MSDHQMSYSDLTWRYCTMIGVPVMVVSLTYSIAVSVKTLNAMQAPEDPQKYSNCRSRKSIACLNSKNECNSHKSLLIQQDVQMLHLPVHPYIANLGPRTWRLPLGSREWVHHYRHIYLACEQLNHLFSCWRQNVPSLGSVSYLLMHWLRKSPEHQQAWYWLWRTCGMYCSIYLGQAKSNIGIKMWICALIFKINLLGPSQIQYRNQNVDMCFNL